MIQQAASHVTHGERIVDKLVVTVALLITLLPSGTFAERWSKSIFDSFTDPIMLRFDGVRYTDFGIATVESLISEPWVDPIFKPQPGQTVMDLGAFAGKYTLRAAALVGPEGHVYSVEPHPDNYKRTEANIASNGFGNVTLLNRAVSDSNGSIELYTPSNTVGANIRNEGRYLQTVDCVTVDDLVREFRIEKVDHIKIDVEGEEVNVLKGARGVLSEHSPELIAEVDQEHQGDVEDILSELGYGYRTINVGRQFNYLHAVSENSSEDDSI